jgi:hypothetical protein
MSNFFRSKWVKIPYKIVLYTFAIYGFFLIGTYFAMKFQWTNDGGMVDSNNRYFQDMHDKYNQSFKVDSVSVVKYRYEALNRIMVVNEFNPTNANYILTTLMKTQDEKLALQMLDAVDLRLMKNQEYRKAVSEMRKNKFNSKKTTKLSVYEWMNIAEWQDFKIAVTKDKKHIDSVAKVTGVESRLIVSCLVGEQIRLFNSSRESYKRYIGPLKVLALESNLSYGVTGIKENTAIKIEEYLKNPASAFYLGEEYETLLDLDSTKNYLNSENDTLNIRLQRLVQFKDHYYSYLYAALFLRQVKMQWQRAGFPIDDRPEILASLFNLGYQRSKPKKNPGVGGSVFKIHETDYTFGAVAFEFYYSGELSDVFPYQKERFKDIHKPR